MTARMDDTVHVQVKIVNCRVVFSDPLFHKRLFETVIIIQAYIVGISTILLFEFKLGLKPLNVLFLEGINYDLRISDRKPSEKRWHSHFIFYFIINWLKWRKIKQV